MYEKMDCRVMKTCQEVQKLLGEDYEVQIQKMMKNNHCERLGITVRERNEKIGRTFYLEEYFQRNVDVETVAHQIAESMLESIPMPLMKWAESFNLHNLGNFKHLIRFKLVNYDANKEELDERPYIRYLDLAIVFYIAIDSNPDGVMTTKIFNYNLADWKITKEELFEIARQNMEREFPVCVDTLKDVLLSGILEHGEEMNEEDVSLLKEMAKEAPALYVMTNRNQTFGASCMLYDSALEDFAESQESNLVILPSSIHEVLLLKQEKGMNFESMREMVMDINRHEVPKEDILSDSVYLYDWKKKELRIAA